MNRRRIDTIPCAVLYDLASGKTLMDTARQQGYGSIQFYSPVSAADYLGPAVFAAIHDALANHDNTMAVTAVFDCGEGTGRALDAIRQGVQDISVKADAECLRRIHDIARQSGTRVCPRPDDRDLFDKQDSDPFRLAKAFATWLGEKQDPT